MPDKDSRIEIRVFSAKADGVGQPRLILKDGWTPLSASYEDAILFVIAYKFV